MYRWILALATSAAAAAQNTTGPLWRSFGEDTSCGTVESMGRPALKGMSLNASSLGACQALCTEVHRDSCNSLEYVALTGSCTLMPKLMRYAHLSTGSECLSLVGEEPVEVFVMLPLETISREGELSDPHGLAAMLDKMEEADVDGFMVDVWWGLTEREPRVYNFTGYNELFAMARARNWKVQVVASFHQCGGNVGDACNITLPPFVHASPGIWYTDAEGVENREYISLFADDAEIGGRTPIDMYREWMVAFAGTFAQELGTLITEVMVGMGPCGELRYPSYPLDRWNFCGVGQFQCFDAHARSDLAQAAASALHPQWSAPPDGAGNYSSYPDDTAFFTTGYKTDYGKFFLDWYSGSLKKHGRRLLAQAAGVFAGRVRITAKVAGIHWWYETDAHAAEATAGYYNANSRNFYSEIAEIIAEEGASMDFTCLEMRRSEQPRHCKSDPEGLLRQAILATEAANITLGGENALPRYDQLAHDMMTSYKPHLAGFTFLRLGADLVQSDNLVRFTSFVSKFHGLRSGAPTQKALRR